MSDDPVIIRREGVEKAFGSVFADVMFRGGEDKVVKERKSQEERRSGIIEAFLRASRDG
jgi:hypothetical protein